MAHGDDGAGPPAADAPANIGSSAPDASANVRTAEELRQWLYAFFSERQPARLPDVERLVRAHGKRPHILVECLQAEYAAGEDDVVVTSDGDTGVPSTPSKTSASVSELQLPASPTKEGYVARILAMFAKYAPEKLAASQPAAAAHDSSDGTASPAESAASRLLARYQGSEVELLAALTRKYGPEPFSEGAGGPLPRDISTAASPRTRNPLTAQRSDEATRMRDLVPAENEAQQASRRRGGGESPGAVLPPAQAAVPPPDSVQIEGLVASLMQAHTGPQALLMANLIEAYGPEPVPTAAIAAAARSGAIGQQPSYSIEARLQRFIAAYWEPIVRDSVRRGLDAASAVVQQAPVNISTPASPRRGRATGTVAEEPELDLEDELNFASAVAPVAAARAVSLDARDPFPGLRLPSDRPGKRDSAATDTPVMPLAPTAADLAALPSLRGVAEPIRWLSRALLWDDAMASEPSWRHVLLTDRALMLLSMHDEVTHVVPLPGPDNRPGSQWHLQVDATVFQPPRQCAPPTDPGDVTGGIGSLPLGALLRQSDDVCVVALHVRPSRAAAEAHAAKDAHSVRFERLNRDASQLTVAEGVAHQAVAAGVRATTAATLVFPGNFLGAPGGVSQRDAAASDATRPPLQRAQGPNAGLRFVSCLAKLVCARGGGPEALELRELRVECDAPPPGFSYVREVGRGLGYRLDRHLLASHIRQASLMLAEASTPSPRRRGPPAPSAAVEEAPSSPGNPSRLPAERRRQQRPPAALVPEDVDEL